MLAQGRNERKGSVPATHRRAKCFYCRRQLLAKLAIAPSRVASVHIHGAPTGATLALQLGRPRRHQPLRRNRRHSIGQMTGWPMLFHEKHVPAGFYHRHRLPQAYCAPDFEL
jgi:hypothetical protein